MARISIFASGNGSNFEALTHGFENDNENHVVLLICDKKEAYAVTRAEKLKITHRFVEYEKGKRHKAENEILNLLKEFKIDAVFLAGFMKILTKEFLENIKIPVVNIHPSLLPKFKGVDGIRQAYESGDAETGITIHYVVPEVDSGEIIMQKMIKIDRSKGIDILEEEIHKLEHQWYPAVAREVCSRINSVK